MENIPELQILMPCHNEADSIESTIRDIYAEISPKLKVEFIVTEDGSTDGTKEILAELEKSIPMTLIMTNDRKGYSQAIQDGMKKLRAPYLASMDSDGQLDPKDFWKFWERRDDFDLQVGWRVNRADPIWRRRFSGLFAFWYQLLMRIPAHDPSCSYTLMTKEIAEKFGPDNGDLLPVGYWWELCARVHRGGYRLGEIAVSHKERAAGNTQVFKLKKMPGIIWTAFVGLFKLWWTTRRKK